MGILGPPYCGIGATIRIGREMLCLPYAGFKKKGIEDTKEEQLSGIYFLAASSYSVKKYLALLILVLKVIFLGHPVPTYKL